MTSVLPTIQLRWTEWGSPDYCAMLDLREEVLRKPLGLTLDRSHLEGEKGGYFLTAWEGDLLVGSLILTLEGNKARMRAVAVKETHRGQRIGEQIVQALEARARELGCTEVYAHARAVVLPFYDKLGYTQEGDEFLEVTIPHRVVRKSLLDEVGAQTDLS